MQKKPKIVIFWKFLTSVTSDFIAQYNTPTCAWSKFLLKKSEKISKKFVRGWLFPKSRDFTPPTGKKCNKEHFNQDETKNFVGFSAIRARMQVFSNF